ncbi:hypothetical protein JXB41_06125 [Candidatus Woesearchaeota archaeon]|nr:hypothetical protein [Candidatus Woesearchaeota archaeon]
MKQTTESKDESLAYLRTLSPKLYLQFLEERLKSSFGHWKFRERYDRELLESLCTILKKEKIAELTQEFEAEEETRDLYSTKDAYILDSAIEAARHGVDLDLFNEEIVRLDTVEQDIPFVDRYISKDTQIYLSNQGYTSQTWLPMEYVEEVTNHLVQSGASFFRTFDCDDNGKPDLLNLEGLYFFVYVPIQVPLPENLAVLEESLFSVSGVMRLAERATSFVETEKPFRKKYNYDLSDLESIQYGATLLGQRATPLEKRVYLGKASQSFNSFWNK